MIPVTTIKGQGYGPMIPAGRIGAKGNWGPIRGLSSAVDQSHPVGGYDGWSRRCRGFRYLATALPGIGEATAFRPLECWTRDATRAASSTARLARPAPQSAPLGRTDQTNSTGGHVRAPQETDRDNAWNPFGKAPHKKLKST